ncbi:Hypothetical_protein [Hexamita inflata]|uniref:Hypothetical_protein n=1 Tax=Hexamita inflata TaxID=28002 RepID=A0AA86PL05_9EUKA|nr:Hypothetical protein HINF_LOCUS25132 [Hexamita inflata]
MWNNRLLLLWALFCQQYDPSTQVPQCFMKYENQLHKFGSHLNKASSRGNYLFYFEQAPSNTNKVSQERCWYNHRSMRCYFHTHFDHRHYSTEEVEQHTNNDSINRFGHNTAQSVEAQ